MSDTEHWFWVSWYQTEGTGPFELHTPWWVSGERDHDNAKTVCAAIPAYDEASAKDAVLASFDLRPAGLEWRFCEERLNVSPFNSRFRRAPWMRWDEPAGGK